MESYIQFLNISLALTTNEKMLKARAKQEYKRMTYNERKQMGLIRKFN